MHCFTHKINTILIQIFDYIRSVFIVDSFSANDSGGWILALTGKDAEGSNMFLQQLWEARSLLGNDLEGTKYKGIDIISEKNQTIDSKDFNIATALVEENLVLIINSLLGV